MPADPRGKARALIERAVHPSTGENEARNSAMAACKLIAEHNLLDEVVRIQRVQTRGPAVSNPFEDLFRAVADMGGDGFFVNIETPPPPRRPRPAPTPPQPSVDSVRRKPKRDPGARNIPITDQAAFCSSCSQRIRRGRYATWTPGGVLYHPTCYDNSTEP